MRYRIVGTVADAVNLRQTVFLRMMESPERLPEADKFAATIRRSAINESLRYLQRRDTDRRANSRLMEQGSPAHDNDPKDVAVCAKEAHSRRSIAHLLNRDKSRKNEPGERHVIQRGRNWRKLAPK